MISACYEQISVGDRAVTDDKEITDDYIRDFAELTGDRHPLHLVDEYAAGTRYGERIAHGALMVSTLLGLVELSPAFVECFYGVDELRFLQPTMIGDRVHAETEVLEVRPRPDGRSAIVRSRGVLVNAAGQEVLSGVFSILTAGRDHSISTEQTS